MIRIEEFLFIQNIEQSQSESLIAKYPNLSFETTAEFFSYFESQGIRLTKKLPPSTIKDDTQILLDRLKEFKSSTDYDYVKKYIIREKVIEEAIQVGRIEIAKNEFDATVKEPLDPFFGFIVRKILTGNENGVLPSENLQSILDEQNRINTPLPDLSVSVDRDSTGKITSFKNYLKNRGFIRFPTITERYIPRSFDYVVDKSFTSIPEAVDAERYVLERAEEWGTDLNISTEEAVLLEKLKKLINEDSTSIPALEAKLEKLQLQLDESEEVQQNLSDTNDNLIEAIEQLSSDYNQKVAESEAKDSQIATLNETIDTTLSDLGTSVTSQIENAADAFDALSSKLEEQSKKAEEQARRAEEQAKAQLDAFKDGIGAIADAIKTSNSNTGTGGGGTNAGTDTGTGGTNTNTKQGNDLTETQKKIAKISGILKKDSYFRLKMSDSENKPFQIFVDFRGVIKDLSWTLNLNNFLFKINLDGEPKTPPSAIADIAKYIVPTLAFVGKEVKTSLNTFAYDSLRDRVINFLQSNTVKSEDVDSIWSIFIRYRNTGFEPKLYGANNIWDDEYIRKILGSVPLEYQNLGNPDVLSASAEKEARRTIIEVLTRQKSNASNNPDLALQIFNEISSLLGVTISWTGGQRPPSGFNRTEWDNALSNTVTILTNAINAVPSEDDSVLAVMYGSLRSPEFGQVITKPLSTGQQRTLQTQSSPEPKCQRDDSISRITSILSNSLIVDNDFNRTFTFKIIWNVIPGFDKFQSQIINKIPFDVYLRLSLSISFAGTISKADYNLIIAEFTKSFLPTVSLQDICDLRFALQDIIDKLSPGGGGSPTGGGASKKYPL